MTRFQVDPEEVSFPSALRFLFSVGLKQFLLRPRSCKVSSRMKEFKRPQPNATAFKLWTHSSISWRTLRESVRRITFLLTRFAFRFHFHRLFESRRRNLLFRLGYSPLSCDDDWYLRNSVCQRRLTFQSIFCFYFFPCIMPSISLSIIPLDCGCWRAERRESEVGALF
jgi:hypothetical protein